jgi:hypothetical protein
VEAAPELVEKARLAREAVAARPEGLDQGDAVVDPPDELQPHIASLLASESGAAMAAEGWEVKVVDLSRIRAAQPLVFSDDAEARVAELDPDDIVALAEITLPIPQAANLPAQFDESQRAWIVSSPNPNLRIARAFGSELQPGVIGLGFAVTMLTSYVSVAIFDGRLILRDGYHRTYGLLARGVAQAPAFVREVPGLDALGLPVGMLPQEGYLGERPPTLSDYHDDEVAASVVQPVAQKMIVIQGLEITPAAGNG